MPSLPVRRRPELVTGPVPAGAQLIVLTTPLRILQGFVCFIDRLDFFLGAGLLADIRMVLARQLAIGALDLRITGVRFHSECVVVILELHAPSI